MIFQEAELGFIGLLYFFIGLGVLVLYGIFTTGKWIIKLIKLMKRGLNLWK